jgi:hypothetical protein
VDGAKVLTVHAKTISKKISPHFATSNVMANEKSVKI